MNKRISNQWIEYVGEGYGDSFSFGCLVEFIDEASPHFGERMTELGLKIRVVELANPYSGQLLEQVRERLDVTKKPQNTFFISMGHSVLSHKVTESHLPRRYLGHFGFHEGGFSFWFPHKPPIRISDSLEGGFKISERALQYMENYVE